MRLFRFLVGWWGGSAFTPPVTPPSRIFKASAESRVFPVAYESRSYTA